MKPISILYPTIFRLSLCLHKLPQRLPQKHFLLRSRSAREDTIAVRLSKTYCKNYFFPPRFCVFTNRQRP